MIVQAVASQLSDGFRVNIIWMHEQEMIPGRSRTQKSRPQTPRLQASLLKINDNYERLPADVLGLMI